MKNKLICISCPVGCHLETEGSSEADLKVSGNKCKRGLEYAVEETFAPRRVVTAVVRTDSEDVPFVPVRTDRPILKKHICGLLAAISKASVKVPVRTGGVLIEDFESSGVNVVFSRRVER